MGYHPEILGLLILACSVNLLPSATEEHRDLNITGMKTRHVRSETDARSSIKFPNNNILPISSGHFARAVNLSKRCSISHKLARKGGADSFVFPDDSAVLEGFIPKISKRTPDCANGTTFCENVENYPSKYVEKMLKVKGKEYVGLFGNDIMTKPKMKTKFLQSPSFYENQLCLSVEQVIYPKTAKNINDEWLYVVNHGKYRQGLKIEKCLIQTNPPPSCEFTEGFPLGYKTECRQKFINRRLVALNGDGQPVTDSFQIPCCCVCIVISTGSG